VVFESEAADGDLKGHADKFWACALACQKERVEQTRPRDVNLLVIGEEIERVVSTSESLTVQPTDEEIGLLARAFVQGSRSRGS